jgi:DNA-binding transcriptional MerR regulator
MTGSPSERLLTTTEAADAVGVQPARIRDWARRGLLTKYATTPDGHPLYLEQQVLDVEHNTRATTRLRGGRSRA